MRSLRQFGGLVLALICFQSAEAKVLFKMVDDYRNVDPTYDVTGYFACTVHEDKIEWQRTPLDITYTETKALSFKRRRSRTHLYGFGFLK